MEQAYVTSDAGIEHLRHRCEASHRTVHPILIYQILTRGAPGMSWQITAPPTRDPWLARRRLHEARRYAASALLVMATTALALAEVVWRLRHDQPSRDLPTAHPSDSQSDESLENALARPLDEQAFLDARRWHLEQGPGGDHDQPYTFALPADGRVVLAWVRLLARVRSHPDR